MAISAELKAMVDLIQDPVVREARLKELTELSENGLRQADYSRKMNDLSTKEKEVEAKHAKNLDWYNKADKQYQTAVNDLKAAQERIAALETVEESRSHLEPDDNSAELNKQLKAAREDALNANKKVVELAGTVSSLDGMIKEGKLITKETFEQEITRRGNALGGALLELLDIERQYEKTYGKTLDRKALLDEADKRGGDLKGAFEIVVAKDKEEKLRKDIRAEVEKEEAEKRKNSTVPYAQGEAPPIGPLQSRLQKKDTGIPDDVAADGSGRLASLIGQELRAEGKV